MDEDTAREEVIEELYAYADESGRYRFTRANWFRWCC